MELVTLATLSAFLKSCLSKGGEKLSEKLIETVFERKKDLAHTFAGLFQPQLLTLGLNRSTTPDEVRRHLRDRPEVALEALTKLLGNPEVLAAFNKQLEKESVGMQIHAENIGQVIKENYGTVNQTMTPSRTPDDSEKKK